MDIGIIINSKAGITKITIFKNTVNSSPFSVMYGINFIICINHIRSVIVDMVSIVGVKVFLKIYLLYSFNLFSVFDFI